MLCVYSLGIVGDGFSQVTNLMAELCIAEATQAFSSKTTKMLRPQELAQSKTVRIEPKTKFHLRMKMNTKSGRAKVESAQSRMGRFPTQLIIALFGQYILLSPDPPFSSVSGISVTQLKFCFLHEVSLAVLTKCSPFRISTAL